MAFLKNQSVRRFTATIAATAIALALMTAAAVPARADSRSDDLAKALAAVAAIAIIGSALNDNKRRNAAPVVVSPRRGEDYYRYDDRRDNRWDRRAQTLPAQCAVEIRGRRHTSVAYLERCLRNSGIDRRLPQSCAIDVRMRGRTTTAYRENCLVDAGYRIRNRRH